jgi:hypothetical protein
LLIEELAAADGEAIPVEIVSGFGEARFAGPASP